MAKNTNTPWHEAIIEVIRTPRKWIHSTVPKMPPPHAFQVLLFAASLAFSDSVAFAGQPPQQLWEIRSPFVGALNGVIAQGTNLIAWDHSSLSWIEPDGNIRWSRVGMQRVEGVLAAPDGTVCAIHERNWSLHTPDGQETFSTLEPRLGIQGYACDSTGTFYLAGFSSPTSAMSEIVAVQSDGTIRWRLPCAFPAAPLVVGLDDRPLIGISAPTGGAILKLNADGSTYWRLPLGATYVGVKCGDADGNLFAPATGISQFQVSPSGIILSAQNDPGPLTFDSSGPFPPSPAGTIAMSLLEDGTQIVMAYGGQGFLPDRTFARITAQRQLLWTRTFPGSANWALVSDTGRIFVLSTDTPSVTCLDGRIPPTRSGWATMNGPNDGSRRMSGYTAPKTYVEPVRWLPDTGFHLAVSCEIGKQYTVQSTADFNSWRTVTNFIASDRRGYASDRSATNGEPRVYRAIRER